MASTTGTFTVTNITLMRSLNVSEATINDAANLLGTLIYDIQEGSYDGTAYTITNAETDRTIDASAFSLTELLNVIATLIAGNLGTAVSYAGFTITNDDSDYVLDCNETSLNELVNVLGTTMFWYYKRHIIWPVSLQKGRTVYARVDKTRNLIMN